MPILTSRRVFTSLAAAALVRPAAAEDFPARAIRIVVPFAPGGSLNILARLYARHLGERLGWQVVVENRSGGGGTIGTDVVAKSWPDGYTILMVSDPIAVLPSLFPNLPFDPLKDLEPLGLIARLSQVLVVQPGFAARDFPAFVAMARARPQGVIMGHTGPASPGHLNAALLGQAGVELTLVPYRGGGPVVQDILAGNLPTGIMTLPAALPFLREGTLRALAVSSPRRSSFLPDVPTMAETLPGVELDSWQALFLPARTPREIVQKLHAEFTATTRMPAVAEWLAGQAFEPVTGPPSE
jgi:tripartite-type tricarboxylate transporter receptor subunit TctC